MATRKELEEAEYRDDVDCCYFCPNSEDLSKSGEMERDNLFCKKLKMMVSETGICKHYADPI